MSPSEAKQDNAVPVHNIRQTAKLCELGTLRPIGIRDFRAKKRFGWKIFTCHKTGCENKNPIQPNRGQFAVLRQVCQLIPPHRVPKLARGNRRRCKRAHLQSVEPRGHDTGCADQPCTESEQAASCGPAHPDAAVAIAACHAIAPPAALWAERRPRRSVDPEAYFRSFRRAAHFRHLPGLR